MKRLKLSKNYKEVQDRIVWLQKISLELGYTLVYHKEDVTVMRFKRDYRQFDIYYTTMKLELFPHQDAGWVFGRYFEIESKDDFIELIA